MSDTDTAERLREWIARGELARAEQAAQQWLASEPPFSPAWQLAGRVALLRGEFEPALKRLMRALSLDGRSVAAWEDLGRLYIALGQSEHAIQAYRRALTVDDRATESWIGLGVAFDNLGRHDEAVGALRQALQAGADVARTERQIAAIMLSAGLVDDAQRAIDAAVAAAPDDVHTAFVLGDVLAARGRHAEAAEAFARAAEGPDRAEALYNRAIALDDIGDWHGAARACEQAVALAPHLHDALAQLVFLKRRLCEWQGLDALSQRLREAVHADADGVTPFSFLAEPASPAEQLRCASSWARAKFARTEAARRRSTLAPRGFGGGAPRVGFVSSGFNNHPTALLIARLIERLAHHREIVPIAFATTPDDGGAMRQRLRGAFDEFHELHGLPHEAMAGRIYDQRIDVLVDLRGYGGGAVTEVFALRPAPLQVNWLAYPGTSGASFIDYLIADAFVVPPAQRAHYSESLVRLPHAFQPSDTARRIAAAPSRESLGLPAKGTVFASFNNSYKISPETFGAWVRCLRDVDGSVLWLLLGKDEDHVRANLRAAASAAGVAPDRLIFQRKLAHDEYLALYAHVDLFLDTWPYNAHTTASDALWAGAPVLTLPGETFASRVAGSLLKTLGLEELIADDVDTYVARVTGWGRDARALAALRERVAAQRASSPLFDMDRLAIDFARAIAHMVGRARKGLAPADVDLAAH